MAFHLNSMNRSLSTLSYKKDSLKKVHNSIKRKNFFLTILIFIFSAIIGFGIYKPWLFIIEIPIYFIGKSIYEDVTVLLSQEKSLKKRITVT